MISAKRIGELIENPAGIQLDEIEGLEKSLEKYPYAAVLRMVVLKGKAIHHAADFETSLEKSANHIMDRAYLFDFLQNPDAEDEVETFEETPVLEEKEEILAVALKDDEKPTKEEVIEKSISQTEKNLIVENEIQDNKEVEEDLSTEILSEVVEVAFQNQMEESIEEEEIHAEIDEENLSFVEWLKLKKEGRFPKKENEVIVKSEPVQEIKSKKSKEKGLSKSDINDLLDRFIEAEPSISRPTADSYSPIKTAQQSLEEQESLVTETLAKIHLLQKNYSKAIETYKRLILVYPEKKTYFATQIEKIRAQKTDQ